MLRFTIQQPLGLTVIAAVSCFLTILVAPADPVAQLMAAAFLFVFGGACYVAGLRLGKAPKL